MRARVRRRLLQRLVRRGLLEIDDAHNMAQWTHGDEFSVDAGVSIETADLPGLE